MQITEAICRRVIECERADLNGSMEQRQDYTGAARAFAGTFAKDWLLDKALLTDVSKLLAGLIDLENDGRLTLDESYSDWIYELLDRCKGRAIAFAKA